jgi:hypothetical protein
MQWQPDKASVLSSRLALLLAGQHQPLGEGGVLDMFPARHHEGQGPDRMAGAVGTVFRFVIRRALMILVALQFLNPCK